MVRKRSNLDSESKMPVKDSLKNKLELQKDLESASMSDKDNSDYSSSKATKVWSRELRNRFVIASNKRSLRFTNVVNPGRHVRSCRMAMTSHPHYSLSQSDDDDDDHMFTPRNPPPRTRHLVKRRRISPDEDQGPSNDKRSRTTPVMNGHIIKSGREDEEVAEGIRRSTRQRKLKYDNYSDSWIVGAQTLRGYPMYGNSYSNHPDLGIKREVELEEEEEEHLKVPGETDELDTEDGGESRKVVVETRRSERRRTIDKEITEDVREADQAEQNNVPQGERPFEDMYSRVKRTRRREVAERKAVNSSDESESSSGEEVAQHQRGCKRVEERKYHLRQTKPTVERFQAHVDQPVRRSSRTLRAVLNQVRRHRRRSSSTSSSSSSSEEQRFERKKGKNKSAKTRSRCLPQWKEDDKDREKAGAVGGGMPAASGRLADVDPISLDTSIRFSDVGGLQEHVRCLQEMVVFPMMYSEVFRKYHVKPPKGVLFHGPPGTGKTLIARALANECSQGERKVTFFMRKGADCLSKWVGESERQLRLLFEQAFQSRPSIIFFDEIDGLAPVRSAKQDQIHASIVSTLLALMDGLDDRGEIVVIGATNRIDAIDPALRRPGRFDRELLFPLPANKERQEILRIHVSKWEHPPSATTLTYLAEMSVGYCGSDLRALCSEAVIQALRRRYPQIYKSSRKLLLDPDNVKVVKRDFEKAQRGIVPASYRTMPGFGRKLPHYLEPLLSPSLTNLIAHVKSVFPCGFVKANRSVRMLKSPRLLVLGQKKATSLVIAALLHRMEHCPVHTLDLTTLYGETSRSPEEATVHVLNEVRRNIPSILYVPGVTEWWSAVGATVRAVFKSLLNQLDPSLPILFIATAVLDIPKELYPLFSTYRNEIYTIKPPTLVQKEQFFRPLFFVVALKPPPPPRHRGPLEELPVAPPPLPPKLSEQQLKIIYDKEENTLRELRIFLRQTCAKLARNKQFFMFSKPVDVKEVPDYLTIIKQPMDLETMMTKIDLHKYTCAQDFLTDIELICNNALEYNPDRDAADKLIRHRACYLRDTAYALIKAEMDSDFEESCREIRNARKTRSAAVDKFAPEFVRAQVVQPEEENADIQKDNNVTISTGCGSLLISAPVPKTANDILARNNLKPAAKVTLLNSELRRKKRNMWSRGLIIRKKGKLKEKKEMSGALGDDITSTEFEATLSKPRRKFSENSFPDKVQEEVHTKRGRTKCVDKLNSVADNGCKAVVGNIKEKKDKDTLGTIADDVTSTEFESAVPKSKRKSSETNAPDKAQEEFQIQVKRGRPKSVDKLNSITDNGRKASVSNIKEKKEQSGTLGDDVANSEFESAVPKSKRKSSETNAPEKLQEEVQAQRRGRPKSVDKINSALEGVCNQQKEKDNNLTENFIDFNPGLENIAQSTPLKLKSTGQNSQETISGEEMSSEDEEQDNCGQEDYKDCGSQNDESVIASDCSYATEATSKGNSKRTVVLHRPSLNKLLIGCVNVTKNISSMETLIDLYAQLRQVIGRYFKTWDRSKLPHELEVELERFANRCKEEDHEFDESFQSTAHDLTFI